MRRSILFIFLNVSLCCRIHYIFAFDPLLRKILFKTLNLSGGETINQGFKDDNENKTIRSFLPSSSLPASLNLTVHDNLLTPEECLAIRRVASPHLRDSKVGRPAKVQPSLRKSLSCKIPRIPIPEIWSVEKKLARAAGLSIEQGEDLQVGGYPVDHYYGMHCDERPGGRPNGGGRLATALAYLNDLDSGISGGHTVFSGRRLDLKGGLDFPHSSIRVRELERLSKPDAEGIRIAPRLGRVVTWRNLEDAPSGDGDVGHGKYRFIHESTHGACKIVDDGPHRDLMELSTIEGSVKYVVQQWFGLKAEANVARHPRLICHLGLGVADSYNINPLYDLASSTGKPIATFDCRDKGNKEMKSVPSLIPKIGATRICGNCASINCRGQQIKWEKGKGKLANSEQIEIIEKDEINSEYSPIAAAIWVQLNSFPENEGDFGSREQRIFRVGPHEISIKQDYGDIVWSIGDKFVNYRAGLEVGKWYHIAITINPAIVSSDGTVTLNADLYLSVPGQAPSKPVRMQLTNVEFSPEYKSGVSIGGCRDGVKGEVDLTVTDFYAMNDDMSGKGHNFAYAVMFYSPEQGI